jgi:long-chain fatty acid transport protein
MRTLVACAAAPFVALACLLAGTAAHATYGPFEHGYGIKSMGAGGIGFVHAEDSYGLGANPAHAALLEHRFDAGLNWVTVLPGGRILGNAAGPDETYRSDGQRHFPIPQAGYVRPLSDRLAIGATMFAAGVGSDYKRNPYERFGAPQRGGLTLGQSGVSGIVAFRPHPDHALGLALNLGYLQFALEGIQPFFALSEQPDKVTDKGRDDAFGFSFAIGWHGDLGGGLSVGAAYRSRSWNQRFDDYAGVLPDQGRLDLPAIWGAGIGYALTPKVRAAIDVQRVEYASIPALGNPLSRLDEGKPLGSDSGPGFGWADQTIYKFGLSWQPRDRLTLRVGYSEASVIVQPSDTLFSLLAQVTGKRHYTTGFTRQLGDGWELSGYYAHMARNEVAGQHSIPESLGGGEARVFLRSYSTGFTFGKRFGGAD